MQYEFKVKITNKNNDEVIEIGNAIDGSSEEKKLLTNVEVHMDTVNEDVRQKSNAILARVKIVGKLDNIVAERAAKIFAWATDYDEDSWYREVEIEVRGSGKSLEAVRTYIIPNMFVVDYKESYNAEGDSSSFELYLTQKDGNMDSIKSFN